MKILLLTLLYVAIEARFLEKQCAYKEWGPWGPCVSSTKCPVTNPVSFQSEPQAWDSSRIVMQTMMQEKIDNNKLKAACRRNPECHDYDRKASTGAHPCLAGMADGIYECDNVNMLSLTDFIDLGYDPSVVGEPAEETAGSDIWGWTDPIDGEEYALMTISGATSFVRIHADGSTTTVGILYSHNTATIWRDVKTVGSFAYIISEASGHGLQVFDLNRLRGLGASNPVRVFTEDAHYGGWGQCHNIVAHEETGFVYGVGSGTEDGIFPATCLGGLFAVDVNDPFNPTYAGCYGGDGYTHDAQCVIYHGPDADHANQEICFGYNENSLSIIDVTDKANMKLISRSEYGGSEYTHQGWLTEDHTTLLLDDELDEYVHLIPIEDIENRLTKTYIWDVKDLDFPVLESIYKHDVTSIDHNQYVLGDYTYQMNYESGLRILRIDQTNFNLHLVAHFDLFDGFTRAMFNGGWSVYPYFESGNLILSSVEYGLFVVKADWDAINTAPAAQETRVRASFGDDSCNDVIEKRTCAETLQC